MCILKAGPSMGPNPVTGKGIEYRQRTVMVVLSCRMEMVSVTGNGRFGTKRRSECMRLVAFYVSYCMPTSQ